MLNLCQRHLFTTDGHKHCEECEKLNTQYIFEDIEITAMTKGGEEPIRTKLNPNKRHSKNNTIIGWNIYKDGKYIRTLWKKLN